MLYYVCDLLTMPEDDEILKNGTVDFVSISYYFNNCVSVTQKGKLLRQMEEKILGIHILKLLHWNGRLMLYWYLRRKIIKRFRQKALLENNISSKGFLIYMDNS